MHVVVKEIEVQTLAFVSGKENERWDLLSGPDLYYEAYSPDEELLYASEVIVDVCPSDLPVALGGGFSVNGAGRYSVRLLDADLVEDEVVARIDFRPERLFKEGPGQTPPTTVSLQEEETVLRMVLEWGRS